MGVKHGKILMKLDIKIKHNVKMGISLHPCFTPRETIQLLKVLLYGILCEFHLQYFLFNLCIKLRCLFFQKTYFR